MLLTQLRRENIPVRMIRFAEWTNDIKNCEVELLCLEDEDRYTIHYDGRIKRK